MTREEAIRKTLDTVLWTRNASDDNKNILTDALIKALEQEPRKDDVILTNKEYRELINKYDIGYCKGYINAQEEQVTIIEKMRAEIEQITDTMGVSYNQYVSKIDVLHIIDKYKAESEEL